MEGSISNLTLLNLERLVDTTRRAIKDIPRLGNTNFDELYKRSVEASEGTLMWAEFFLQRGSNIPHFHAGRVKKLISDVQDSYMEIEDIVRRMLKEYSSASTLKLMARGNKIIERIYEIIKQRLHAISTINLALNRIALSLPLHGLPERLSSKPHITSTEEYGTKAHLTETLLGEDVELERVDGRSTESQFQSYV